MQLRDPYAGLSAADALVLSDILRRVARDSPADDTENESQSAGRGSAPRRRVVAVSCSDAGSEGVWAAVSTDDVFAVAHGHAPHSTHDAELLAPRSTPHPGALPPQQPPPPSTPVAPPDVSPPPLPSELKALARSRTLFARLHDAFDWLIEPLGLVVCRRPLPGPSPRSPRLLGGPFLLLRMFKTSLTAPAAVLGRFIVTSLALSIFMGVLFSASNYDDGFGLTSRVSLCFVSTVFASFVSELRGAVRASNHPRSSRRTVPPFARSPLRDGRRRPRRPPRSLPRARRGALQPLRLHERRSAPRLRLGDDSGHLLDGYPLRDGRAPGPVAWRREP